MTKIKFTVAGQQLKRLTMPYLVRDSKRHIQLDFEFMTRGWADCIKTVVFKTCDGIEASKMLNENNTMRLPTKIAAAESFTVSVFGVNLTDDIRITTNLVEVILNKSGYSEVGEIEEPPPDVYEQILKKLEEMGEPDPEAIEKAVNEWLENNPIQGSSHEHENKSVLDDFGIDYSEQRPTFRSNKDGKTNIIALQQDVTARVAEHRAEVLGLISAIPKFSIVVVDELPTEDISETTVYLLKCIETDGNLYTEYIYINNAWETLGTQNVDVDLTEYYTKSEIDGKGFITAAEIPEIANVVVDLLPKYNGEVETV